MLSQKVLLVDFGASRIKSVLVDLSTSVVIDRRECPSPSCSFLINESGTCEIDVNQYWIALEQTAGALIDEYAGEEINRLWICSEMHGFILADEFGKELTGYISWKDERAILDSTMANSKDSTYLCMKKELTDFYQQTGMQLKPGLPIVTLASGIRKKTIPQINSRVTGSKLQLLTLVDWLMIQGGEPKPLSNETMSASTGLYDIHQKNWSHDLLEKIGAAEKTLMMPLAKTGAEVLGRITLSGKQLSVYGGVGDLQAALHGTGFPEIAPAIINLGTGSQVAIKASTFIDNLQVELRPLVGGTLAQVITHIPSGRALNVFKEFIDSIAQLSGGSPLFWELWESITVQDICNSQGVANLNVFGASWKRASGIEAHGWIGLDERFSSPREVIADIAKAWLIQYVQALNILDPNYQMTQVLVSGGLARRGKFVLEVLGGIDTKRNYEFSQGITGEETLDGLLRLAKEA
jgi:sugar (pentulose or hexulose) kinase